MRQWWCPCGFEGETSDDVEVLYHACNQGHTLGGIRPMRDRDQDRKDRARTLLGASLEESVKAKHGDNALLREVEQHEAEDNLAPTATARSEARLPRRMVR